MHQANHPNMQAHDDLAALFSRNLTLHQRPPPSPPQEQKQPDPHHNIVYSISQHYHHSSHLVNHEEEAARAQAQAQAQLQQQQRPNSLPPPETQGPTVEQILTTNGINPAILSPPQLQLFKTADDTQKLRLLELWRICPPTPPTVAAAAGTSLWEEARTGAGGVVTGGGIAWNETTVEREECLARMRYEQQQQKEAQQQHDEDMMLQEQLLLEQEQQIAQQQRQLEQNQRELEEMEMARQQRGNGYGGNGALEGADWRCQQANAPLTRASLVPLQGGDGRWINLVDSQGGREEEMEPYMASGYEQLSRKEYVQDTSMAERPRDVYAHFGTAVGGPNYVQATDPVYRREMENQYGGFQMRGTCGLDSEMEVV